MQAEKADIEARLKSLRSGSVKPVSKEEKAHVDAELRKVEKCAGARARIVKEMWGAIADAVPRDQWADLREDLGVEI
jgi:26S proteasome regulatory subunit (ATPase 3-interacting protein)